MKKAIVIGLLLLAGGIFLLQILQLITQAGIDNKLFLLVPVVFGIALVTSLGV